MFEFWIFHNWTNGSLDERWHMSSLFYEVFEKHRSNKPGCDVGSFVAEKLEFVKRNDLCYFDDCIECVSIEIDRLVFSTKRNVVVSVIYRPPNTDTRHFNEKLCALLECISSEKKLCYLIGDYNINILNYGNHSATDEFVDMLYSHAFLPLINRPTRITQTSATIIDNIFTNNIDERECGQNGILVTDISDHFPIFHIGHNTQVIESDETYIISRNYSNVNKLSFQQALSEIDWSEIYMISDAQPAFTWFYSRFIKLFDKHFPKRTIKCRYNTRKPWLTPALKESIRIKNNCTVNSWKSDHHIMSVNIDGTETSWIRYWNMPKGNILQNYWSQINLTWRKRGTLWKILTIEKIPENSRKVQTIR